MLQDVRREARLSMLVALIVGTYGVAVAAVAAAHGQSGLLQIKSVNGPLVIIWVAAFAFVFVAYAADLTLRRRPKHPLRVLIAEFRAEVLRPDWLLARATVVLGWFFLMLFFTPLKRMIGHVQGFPWDHALVAADRALFLGHDPWTVTHALFGGVAGTALLQTTYNLWFGLMWLSIIYAMLKPDRIELRSRYLIAFLLCWTLIGSLGAYLLASAGPCYFERAFGDPHFEPLMAKLKAIDAELLATAPSFRIWALNVQDMLWSDYAAKGALFGGGISAMPSMHVSTAVLMALGGQRLGRLPAVLLWTFALLIWIGSIHLGWHYALDGIVAAALTLILWRVAGWLVEHIVLAERGTRARAILA